MTKTDMQLKEDIEQELRFDPRVNAAQIGVSVDKGAVSLLGSVDTYAEKWAAEEATKRVGGVRAFAQDLKVKILDGHVRNDSDIAGAIETAFKWDVSIPKTLTAKVQQGSVTLEGKVAWNYEREAAERAVQFLTGVVDVSNYITIEPAASAAQVKEKVEAALHRQAKADAKSIRIQTAGGRVTLSGDASSWQSIADAETAAWAAPGVTEVIDHLRVSPGF